MVRDGILQSSGSGFAIGTAGQVVTNNHVIAAAASDEKIRIMLCFTEAEDGSEEYEASIVWNSSQEDLAILSIDRRTSDFLTPREGPSPLLMTEILVMGYPLGQGFKSTPGYIQAFQTISGMGEMYDLSSAVDPGSSGGPVINMEGEVVGVVTAQLRGYNFNLALPLEALRGYVEKAGNPEIVRIKTNPPGSRVFADGRYAGISPLSLELYGRNISLRVESEGFEPKEVVVEPLTGKAKWEINLEPIPEEIVTVRIESVPEGAAVWVDNREMGTTPMQMEADPSSRIRILAKLRRHKDIFKTVRIGDEPEQTIVLEF